MVLTLLYRLAYIVSIALLVCIAVSIIAIVIETLPSLRDDDEAGKVFIGIVRHHQLMPSQLRYAGVD